MAAGIYEICNVVNGNRYIGSALRLSFRRNQHFSDLSLRKHGNGHLQRAYDKYGEDAFAFHVICSNVPGGILTRLEQAAMKILEPEYNIAKTAGSSLGLRRGPMKPEHKEAIRRALTGRTHSKETKRKMSLAAIGNTRCAGRQNSLGYRHNAEAKERIGDASRGNKHALGYSHTEDAKTRIGRAARGNPHGLLGAHARWHSGRGIVDSGCEHCQRENRNAQ